jgi:C1A family cysteine protease
MNKFLYYQQNDKTVVNFVPFSKAVTPKKSTYFSIFRNIFVVSCCIVGALFTYTMTFSSPVETLSLEITDQRIKYSGLDANSILQLFEEFKVTYNKTYTSVDEENLRYIYFRNFLKVIDERNGNDTLAVHGITKFADLSNDEFKKVSLGYKPLTSVTNAKSIYLDAYDGNKTYINWANIYTTSVKDQGYCGSCWAFSATEQIESDAIRLGLLTTSDTLSPEQIVQCDTMDDGCDGGNTETAFEYVKMAGGIETEDAYPYTSYYDVTGSCRSNSTDFLVTVDEYYSLADEDAMITHMFSTGPISICLDASSWSSYVSGIITTCGMDVDHCVQAVGINMDDGYWIVRNSWGTEWGNEGYIWLEVGSNMCNIAYDPKYLQVSTVSTR